MLFPQLVQIEVQNTLSSTIEESIFLREATETMLVVPSHPEVVPFFTS